MNATTTYPVTSAFIASVREFKNPWFIVNDGYVVGAYEGRQAARDAKAAENLVGKIVSQKEVSFEIEAELIEAEEIEAEEAKPTGFEEHGLTHCPVCGTHLSNGVGEHGQEVNGKPVKHAEFKYCCLACEAEFGPAIEAKVETKTKTKAKAEAKVIENRSRVEKPCRLVWDLADSMPGARRKDVIAAAEAKGVAFYTARTQYQLWAQVQKEMADREAAVKK